MKQMKDDRSIEEKVQELKQLAQQEMRDLKVPGVAVGLIVGEQELAPYTGGYVMAPTGDIFNFTARDGCMIMSHTIGGRVLAKK